jgi:hypothetical protein
LYSFELHYLHRLKTQSSELRTGELITESEYEMGKEVENIIKTLLISAFKIKSQEKQILFLHFFKLIFGI